MHTELRKHAYLLSSKLQLAELYFGTNVDKLIEPLGRTIEKNYDNKLALKDQITNLDAAAIQQFIDRDYSTIPELTERRIEMLAAMRQEIDETNKYLYSQELSSLD